MSSHHVLLDGAVGTNLWRLSGCHLPVCQYNKTQPELVVKLTEDFILAGAKIIQTNTFPLTIDVPLHLEEEIDRAVQLSKKALSDVYNTNQTGEYSDVRIGLSLGPLIQEKNKRTDKAYISKVYARAISAAIGNIDVIELMTFGDVEMMSVAVSCAKRYGIPVFPSMSFTKNGKTYGGDTVEHILKRLSSYNIDAIGINCSYGPSCSYPILKQFAQKTCLPLFFKPNNFDVENSGRSLSVKQFVDAMRPSLEYATYIGGCCGTTTEDIKALGCLLS